MQQLPSYGAMMRRPPDIWPTQQSPLAPAAAAARGSVPMSSQLRGQQLNQRPFGLLLPPPSNERQTVFWTRLGVAFICCALVGMLFLYTCGSTDTAASGWMERVHNWFQSSSDYNTHSTPSETVDHNHSSSTTEGSPPTVGTASTKLPAVSQTSTGTTVTTTTVAVPGTGEITPADVPSSEPRPSRPLSSKGEVATLAALHRIFGPDILFTKVRPVWLRNDRTGRALELDLFSEELMLGCEYDGVHHHAYPNSFHKSRAQFDDQVYRDRLKDELTKANRVTLIRIPFTIPFKKIEAYLREELRERGWVVPL